ncbi:SDR family oxidoreductase [Rudaeicoccus suwonensis]|uniref:NAD(P)-dependent dehydrogenase (Short-subunit alcohol dehydrogenase family) n=1 Tax=Rudaeicoccus suwonensis TaxID=657409 RepID=A0A561EBC6_9MICO|nr:SDR family oxidoreductase [Rudaeicoccus suwonensis]TWE12923.1 NAD(P)-dependent dehydrogenase (short-subunit alcohol dehydrogenase family) [Rudaeicoccus suwonensis]
MTDTKRVLIVGGGSGVARALAVNLVADGFEVVLGSRNPQQVQDKLPEQLREVVRSVRLDLADEDSIAAVAAGGPFEHVVSLAANHANGPIGDLTRDAIHGAFDAKVVGPLLLAKHLDGVLSEHGAFVFLSGVAAWKPAPGLSVMATTNGAVSFLAEALAVELAPHRVVAVSPGIIDSGAWDGMGAGKQELFEQTAAANPARRVGQVEDVVSAIRLALDNTFVTGSTIHVDGGGRLA